MSQKNTLGDETILDEVVKGYLEGDKTWNEVTKAIASEGVTKSKKKPRERKGPWMKNRRENRNTRKARIYQFTQKAYDQNKKATINKIINGNFSLDNREQVFPEISEVEKVYEKRLEQGNQKDETIVDFPDENLSDLSSLKELKRNTAAGTDGITTPDLRKVPTGHVTAVMSYWWDWRLPPNSEECHTTLLRKKDEELEKVGNWRPITVGNLFIRLYAKLWDKRLRKNITLDERQEGFVPVDGCFQNVKIIQQIVKQQKKNRKEYNLVFIDLAKAFDTVSHLSIKKGLKRKGIPEQVRETILAMYKDASTKLTVGGKTTTKININSVVKQGCPLLPLLFNLIIDELIEKLKEYNIGVQLGDSKSAVWPSLMIWCSLLKREFICRF